MTRSAWIPFAFLAAAVLAPAVLTMGPHSAAAQQSASAPALTPQQQLGRQLFNQSCLVCHTKPQITSGMYGLPLSRDTAGGEVDVIRGIITNGTPRMPAFKYQFTPEQIDAIANYVKTLPPPTTTSAGRSKGDVD